MQEASAADDAIEEAVAERKRARIAQAELESIIVGGPCEGLGEIEAGIFKAVAGGGQDFCIESAGAADFKDALDPSRQIRDSGKERLERRTDFADLEISEFLL